MSLTLGQIVTDLWNRLLGLDSKGNFIVNTGGVIGVKGQPFTIVATETPGAGGSNEATVMLQVNDVNGNPIAFPHDMDVWLSDAASGAGLTATTASGAVAAGTNGADMGDYTAKKAKRVQTDATGKYQLTIVDAAKTHFYVCASLGVNVGPQVLLQLLTASYG